MSAAAATIFAISIFVVVATLAAALTLESANTREKRSCGCRKHK